MRDGDCALGSVCRDGVCRTTCDMERTNAECMRKDFQLVICQERAGEYLCFANNERMPDCRLRSECGDMQSCIDGICRNR
jgi:hypothetical protein